MTGKVIEFVFVLRALLGFLVLVALSLWQSPFQTHLSSIYTYLGLPLLLCMLGALIVGVPLVCLLTTFFYSLLTSRRL
jgi:hypothetical protein